MWPLSMDSRTQSIWALSEIEINSLDLASPERFISQLCWVFTRWVRVGTGLLSLDLFGVQFQLPLSISLKCSPLSSGFWMKRFSPLPLVAIFRPLGTVSSVWRSLYDTVTLFLSSDLIRQQWPLSLDFFRTRLVLWFAVSSDFFFFFFLPQPRIFSFTSVKYITDRQLCWDLQGGWTWFVCVVLTVGIFFFCMTEGVFFLIRVASYQICLYRIGVFWKQFLRLRVLSTFSSLCIRSLLFRKLFLFL